MVIFSKSIEKTHKLKPNKRTTAKLIFMKPLLLVLAVAFAFSSCRSKNGNTDDYYTDHGDWDDVRFPLIKPYEALCLNGSHTWYVQATQNAASFFSAPGTTKLNIAQKTIFLYSTNTILNGANAREAWFVLIPDKHIEKSFATHREYLDYLHALNMNREPKLYEIDQVAEYWGKRDTIDWQHIDD
jgi:hypothetical protein